MKRVLLVGAGLVSFCFSATAQIGPPGMLGLLNRSFDFPALALANDSSFSFASITASTQSMLPDSLPAWSPTSGRVRMGPVTAQDSSKESPQSNDAIYNKKPFFDYATGSIGGIFGYSSGKWGGAYEAGYMTGTVGNDKMQISAGASYEHWDNHFSRH